MAIIETHTELTVVEVEETRVTVGLEPVGSVTAGEGLVGGGATNLDTVIALSPESIASLEQADSSLQSVGATTDQTVVDATDPKNPVVGLHAAVLAALSLATSSLQPVDIGSVVQAWAANLDSWSVLTPASKQDASAVLSAYAAGDTPSTFTKGIVDAVDAAAWRTAIGAGTSSFDGAFSSLTGTPTTLAGYGITDGATDAELASAVSGLSSVYQPLNAKLTAYAGGDTPSAFTLGIVDAADAAAWRAAIGASSVTPAALTKTDDTNVTLTLGGTPTTALLQATSMTLGWSGQLSVARGGTGAATLTGYVKGTGTAALTASSTIPYADLTGVAASSHTHAAADITSGVLATARLGSGTASTAKFLRGDGTWSDTLSGTLSLNGGGNVLVGYGDSAYLSMYNTAGTTRSGYLQMNAGSGLYLEAEGSTFISFAKTGERMRLDTNAVQVGMLRAAAWYGEVAGTIGGAAAEIGWNGSSAYLLAYNRGSSAYVPLTINGSTVRVEATGGSITLASAVIGTSGTWSGAHTFGSATRFTSITAAGLATHRYDDNGVAYLEIKNGGITGASQGYGIRWQYGTDATTFYDAGKILMSSDANYASAGNRATTMVFYTAVSATDVEGLRISGTTVSVAGSLITNGVLQVRGSSSSQTTNAAYVSIQTSAGVEYGYFGDGSSGSADIFVVATNNLQFYAASGNILSAGNLASGSSREFQFKGTSNNVHFFYGAVESVYLRAGTTSGSVFMDYGTAFAVSIPMTSSSGINATGSGAGSLAAIQATSSGTSFYAINVISAGTATSGGGNTALRIRSNAGAQACNIVFTDGVTWNTWIEATSTGDLLFSVTGAGSFGEKMKLTTTTLNLLGKRAFQFSDTYLRLNESGDFSSGVYTPGVFRADGGITSSGGVISTTTYITAAGSMRAPLFYNQNDTSQYIQNGLDAGTTYGQWALGGTRSSYCGLALLTTNTPTFMGESGGTSGIYCQSGTSGWRFWSNGSITTVQYPLHLGNGAGGKPFLYLDSGGSSTTGGKITVSTSAASGTPADGDLWFQRAA